MKRLSTPSRYLAAATVSLLALATATTSPASAQTQTPATPAAAQGAKADSGIQEVIITSTKRPEKLSNVPASIVALSPHELDQANVSNFDDLANVAPDLTITNQSNLANANPTMRGIGTLSYGLGSESSVAVITDDQVAGRAAAAFGQLPDVAQIEVLRGPQSTLFGISADAGAIYITTQMPTNVFHAHVEAGLSDDHDETFKASVSGPVTSSLKLGLAVAQEDFRGTVHNLVLNTWDNGNKSQSARAHVVWTPNADWTVTFIPKVSAQSIDGNVAPYTTFSGITTFGNKSLNLPISEDLGGVVPGRTNTDYAAHFDPYNKQTDHGFVLKIEHDMGQLGTLTSTTTYDHYRFSDVSDSTPTALNWSTLNGTLLNKLPIEVVGEGDYGFYTNFHTDTTSQDFRLVSPNGGRFHYVVGAYYSSETISTLFERGFMYDFTQLVPPGYSNVTTYNKTTYAATTVLNYAEPYSSNAPGQQSYYAKGTTKTAALYTEDSYDLTDSLTIRAGLRAHTEIQRAVEDDLTNNLQFGGNCSNTIPTSTPGLPVLTGKTCSSQDVLLGKIALEYKVTSHINLFADASNGFKGRAFDFSSGTVNLAPLTSGPFKGQPTDAVLWSQQPVPGEETDNYEIGIKSNFFGRRLIVNATAFDERVHNFQFAYTDPATNLSELTSIPQLRTRGLEFEVDARPTTNLSITSKGAWDLARVVNWATAPCFPSETAAQGCNSSVQNLSGARMATTPKFTTSNNVQQIIPLPNDYSALLNANWRWQSGEYLNINQDPGSFQKSFGILNLFGGVQHGLLKAVLSVNNVFNQYYATYKATVCNQCSINPYNTVTATSPRSDAIVSAPARDSHRYVMLKLYADY